MDFLALLPHTPPMRLIEEVVSVEPGRQAVGRRRTHRDDFYFQGHFPGEPVVPAVVLIELIAQAGGLAAGAPVGAGPHEPRAMRVAAVDAFRFPAGCGADETLEVTARVVGRMGGLYKIEGTVTAGATLVARGSLTLAEVGRGGEPSVKVPAGTPRI